MALYTTMSYPPHDPYQQYGQWEKDEIPVTYPPYTTAFMPSEQQYFTSPFPQPAPFPSQQASPFPIQQQQQLPSNLQYYPNDQPSPAYTSPAYTPGPHIMQYLSPPPSSATYSPAPTPQTHLPPQQQQQQQQALSIPATHSLPPPPPPPPRATPSPPGRAVVIGINYFNQKGEMHHRVDEARNLARYLTQVKHYPAQNIMLLTDDQNGPNGQPTKRNILGALFWLARNAREGEKLVLYYSGHGRVATAKKRRGRGAGAAAKGKGKGKIGDDAQEAQGEKDAQQDEDEADGLETIYPVDFRSFKEGMIKPSELQQILKPARDVGAKLTIILDAHTGHR